VIAGVSVEHLWTLINSQLHPSPYTSAGPSPVKPANHLKIGNGSATVAEKPRWKVNEHDTSSPDKPRPKPTSKVTIPHEKSRWSATAPVFVPKSSSVPNRRPFIEPNDSSDSSTSSIASSPPSPAPVVEPGFGGKDESAPKRVDDWYEYDDDDNAEYFKTDRQDRTVKIHSLSQFTTLADIAGIVRGGIILNMHIRARDRIALVSFVEPMAAEKFIMHCRRNEVYLKGKRLEVTWADSSQYLPGYIARQVHGRGARRNIVIRFAKKGMTEKTVREDLEHIHRLEVVSVVTTANHIFISLNGIQWAITARHCMRSQLKYQGTRIEFFEDECDQVLPAVERKIVKRVQENTKRPATVSMANRFALLFDSDDGSTDGGHSKQAVKRSVSDEVKPPA
jgi:hypothetical protein